MTHIVLTGGTGFIGGHLCAALLARGDEVTAFTRSASDSRLPEGVHAFAWTPLLPGPWQAELAGRDVVVHLAGEQAVGQRWNDVVKQRIWDSRVVSTRRLVEGMKAAEPRPRTFVCASAVGYYGDRPKDETLTEDSSRGDGFLAKLTEAWEAAAAEATELGIRVVSVRIGIVLGPDGGALQEMVKPFRAFVGGPIGSGKQGVSWISLDDMVRVLLTCIDDDALSGPVNAVAPNPVSNAELSRAIGEVLGRPCWLKVPTAALTLRFGEGAQPLVEGQWVTPEKLERRGFSFTHTDVRSALRAAL